MIILILINIVVIILIYLRYYNYPKEVYTAKEKIEDYDSMTIGYIKDKGITNNFDLILSGIIELNIKGYLTIEYGKDDLNKTDYIIKHSIDQKEVKIKQSDMLVLNFLFKEKSEITKRELEQKLVNSFEVYNMQFNELQNALNKQITEQNIIDLTKQKELKIITKIYLNLSFALVLLICILILTKVLKFSIFYLVIYILEKLLANIMLLKASNYTIKGQILKYNIDKYEQEIKNQEFLVDKKTMEEIVKDKKFAMSLALHVKTAAKKFFVDDKITQNAIKKSKKVAQIALILTFIVTTLTLAISYAVSLMPKDVIVWLYIIFAIIMACITDIIFAKGYKRK